MGSRSHFAYAFTLTELPAPWHEDYWGRLRTRRFAREPGHALKLAC